MQIQDMKVLVTGGGQGMGRCFVLSLAKEGADVSFCDLNAEAIAEVESAAEGLAGSVKGFMCDVSQEDQVQKLVADAAESMGGLNGLVNNAGIIRDGLLVKKDRETGALKSLSLKKWQQVIDVDLTGPFLCTREFAAACVDNGHGGVVVIISSAF